MSFLMEAIHVMFFGLSFPTGCWWWVAFAAVLKGHVTKIHSHLNITDRVLNLSFCKQHPSPLDNPLHMLSTCFIETVSLLGWIYS